MTVTTGVIAVCAVVIVLLGYVVWRLSRRLREISDQIARLEDQPKVAPTTSVAARPDSPGGAPLPGHRVDGRPTSEPVSVITGMSRTDDTTVDGDVSASRVASVTLAGPLIKVAAFSHGVRRALDDEHRMRVAYAVRKELKQQRKMRRRRNAHKAPSQGWRP